MNIFQSQWKKAEQNFKDALTIDPNNLAVSSKFFHFPEPQVP